MNAAEPNEVRESVSTALSGVMVAGQHLLVDRIDLALFEWRQSISQLVVRLALLILGGFSLVAALIVFDVALIDWLGRGGSRTTALLFCAGLHVVGGGLLLFAGLRHRASAAMK
jgi:hypothetical protein